VTRLVREKKRSYKVLMDLQDILSHVVKQLEALGGKEKRNANPCKACSRG
jgi:hypothetical protein